MFYENFARLCAESGKSESAVALDIGISKPTVTAWRKGGGANNETAKKIADYFGVSIQCLIGEKEESTTELLQEIRDEQRILLDVTKDMDGAQIKRIADMIRGFKND